jgi:hypothetical protein
MRETTVAGFQFGETIRSILDFLLPYTLAFTYAVTTEAASTQTYMLDVSYTPAFPALGLGLSNGFGAVRTPYYVSTAPSTTVANSPIPAGTWANLYSFWRGPMRYKFEKVGLLNTHNIIASYSPFPMASFNFNNTPIAVSTPSINPAMEASLPYTNTAAFLTTSGNLTTPADPIVLRITTMLDVNPIPTQVPSVTQLNAYVACGDGFRFSGLHGPPLYIQRQITVSGYNGSPPAMLPNY